MAADMKPRPFRSLSDKSLLNSNTSYTIGRAVHDVGEQKSYDYDSSLNFSPNDVHPRTYQATERVESELNYPEALGHFQVERDTLQEHQAQAHYQQHHGKPNWSHHQVHYGSLHDSYGYKSMSSPSMWQQQGQAITSYHNPITSNGLPMHNYQAHGIQGDSLHVTIVIKS